MFNTKYLGSSISADGRVDRDINKRIQKESSVFGRFRGRVFSCHTKHTPKYQCMNVHCISTLLYGSETWTMYDKQAIEVLSYEMFAKDSAHYT